MKALSFWAGLVCWAFSAAALGAPANDNFNSATSLVGLSAVRTDSNVGATAQFGEPDHDGYAAEASVWYRWTAPQNCVVSLTTAGSNFDTILAVYTGSTLSSLTYVKSNDEDGDLSTSALRFAAYAGVTYRIAVDGFVGDMGTIHLSLSARTDVTKPDNDNYVDAPELIGDAIDLSSSNYFTTLEAGELTPTSEGGASVWWIWQAPADERYLITTEDSDFDTVLSIYNGSSLVAWNDDSDDADVLTSSVHFNAKKGVRYAISVQGYKADMGSIRLQVYPDPPKPAPDWTLVDMDDQTWRLSDFAGQVVVLDFWATWCGPCVEEVPTLIDLQKTYGPDGLVIVGVSVDSDGWDSVIPFAINNDVNYIETLATSQIESDYGGIPLIPTTFIIDRNGLIAQKFVGGRSRADFESVLIPLLYPAVAVNLGVSVEPGNLVLSWPVSAAGYALQSATDLSSASNWSAFTGTLSVEIDLNIARIPFDEARRWFRLVHN